MCVTITVKHVYSFSLEKSTWISFGFSLLDFIDTFSVPWNSPGVCPSHLWLFIYLLFYWRLCGAVPTMRFCESSGLQWRGCNKLGLNSSTEPLNTSFGFLGTQLKIPFLFTLNCVLFKLFETLSTRTLLLSKSENNSLTLFHHPSSPLSFVNCIPWKSNTM